MSDPSQDPADLPGVRKVQRRGEPGYWGNPYNNIPPAVLAELQTWARPADLDSSGGATSSTLTSDSAKQATGWEPNLPADLQLHLDRLSLGTPTAPSQARSSGPHGQGKAAVTDYAQKVVDASGSAGSDPSISTSAPFTIQSVYLPVTSDGSSTVSSPTTVRFHLPTYWPPPRLTERELRRLCSNAAEYMFAHGVTYHIPGFADETPATGVLRAPVTLLPTPFPAELYETAKRLQRLYNGLYARISMDWAWLEKTIEPVTRVDGFTHDLYYLWLETREFESQPYKLGIFRSDYMLDCDDAEDPRQVSIKQVEFNTIASSFGSLSEKVHELHRYLQWSCHAYYASSQLLFSPALLDVPRSLHDISAALAEAHRAYGNPDAIILMIVQDNERNAFDQRWLEYNLFKDHGILVRRSSLTELYTAPSALQFDRDTANIYAPMREHAAAPPPQVGVVYFRAGYTPDDYTDLRHWEVRKLIELSTAIKCPTLSMQLAGAKKVQQVLSEPGVLEDFMLSPNRPDVGFGAGAGSVTARDLEVMRGTWMTMYPMDNSDLGRKAYELATQRPESWVLKPQREGGGNNIYKENIPPFLQKLEEEDRARGVKSASTRASGAEAGAEPESKEGYILMQLIKPPKRLSNWLWKGTEPMPVRTEVISELGVYGSILFHDGRSRDGESANGQETINENCGVLLRTKGSTHDEGGVAVGISCIDSPLLVPAHVPLDTAWALESRPQAYLGKYGPLSPSDIERWLERKMEHGVSREAEARIRSSIEDNAAKGAWKSWEREEVERKLELWVRRREEWEAERGAGQGQGQGQERSEGRGEGLQMRVRGYEERRKKRFEQDKQGA